MSVRSERSNSFNVLWLIVLHLAIVLPLAYFLNIWTDEASTLYSTQHGFLNAFQHAATDEKQAPLYFWIMSLWRLLNDSIFFARLFAVIVSCVSIAFFARLARRMFEPPAAWRTTAFFAFHPFLVWASVEIRVYASVILLSILLMTFFQKGFFEDPDAETGSRRKSQIIFLLISIVALYTNYYLGFLLVGMFAALVATRQWRAARDYTLVMLVVGLTFVPQLFTIKSQFLTNTSGYREPTSLAEGLRTVWHHVVTFLLPTGILRDGDGSAIQVIRAWIVRLALVALVILSVIFRQKLSRRTVATGATAATIGGTLFAAYFLVGLEYIQIRHASVLFVPLILVAASIISDLSQRDASEARSSYFIPAVGVVVLLAFSYAIVTLYPNMTKRGDWARVGEFIQQNESSGQPIVVFPTFDAIALPYHYKGVNQILPKEKFFTFEQEAPFGTENSLKHQIDFVTSRIPPAADSIWLVEHEQCMTTDACRPLENFVKANYTIEKEQEFYLEKVFLLKKKPQ